jgi:hypothetical protein
MEFPDFAPPIVVTQTYKRKKGRGPRFQSHSMVPSPLRHAMSISQYASEEEEETIPKLKKSRTSGTPPPRKTPHTTPPSTPPRKRKGGSQSSSPVKSSPSPKKVSIDRELGRIFSPKSSRIGERKIDSDEEDEESIPSSQSSREALEQSPKKPSFADRMAPKKSKRAESARTDNDGDMDLDYAEVESQLSEVLSSHSSSQEDEEAVPVMPSVFLQAPSERVYRRSRGMQEDLDPQMPSTKMMVDDLGEGKPCLKELSARWAELDDLDEGEGDIQDKPAIDSITELRARGQSRRFREDYQYLVLELSPSQSLPDRRSTCVEIAKKVLTWEDEMEDVEIDADGDAEEGQKEASEAPDILSSFTPFLREIKMADLIGQMWKQLRLAGAGSGEDEVIDLAFALICLKTVKSDPALLLALSRLDDFSPCMAVMMAAKYEAKTGGKAIKRHLSTLKHLAVSSAFSREDKLEVSPLVLQTVCTLAEVQGNSNSEPSILIFQVAEDTQCSIASQLWHRIASEAEAVMEQRTPNNRAVILIAQIIGSCIGQINSAQRLDSSTADLATLLRYYANISPSEDSDITAHQSDTLCSLLRMIVALMSLEGCEWDSDLVNAEGVLDCVVQLSVKSASQLIDVKEERDRSRIMDAFTLCLALLTDFLTKAALPTRQRLSASESKSGIVVFAQLLYQQMQESDADANSGYLTGSLSVVLAMLVVGSNNIKAQLTSSNKDTNVMDQIKKGLQCTDTHSTIVSIRDCLLEFSEMVKVASRNQQDILPQHICKAKEDEEFFNTLTESLTELLQSHPSSS